MYGYWWNAEISLVHKIWLFFSSHRCKCRHSYEHYNFSFNVIKVHFFFTRENNIGFRSKPAFCLSFIVDILIYTSIKVTIVFGPFKMITKLRFLRFGRFIDIHIMSRTLHGCLGIRILSFCADGTLEEKIWSDSHVQRNSLYIHRIYH